MITLTPNTISALRTARAQCMIRLVQLSGCRVCGAEQQRFQVAVDELDKLIPQLENTNDVQILEDQPE